MRKPICPQLLGIIETFTYIQTLNQPSTYLYQRNDKNGSPHCPVNKL